MHKLLRSRREYFRKRYHSIRNEAIIYLGGKCKECGSKTNLEFDHINRDEKTVSTGKIMSMSLKTFWNEIEKCQLLCKKCHNKKTRKELGKAKHGSLTMYTHHRCRCVTCTRRNRKYSREYKQKMRERILIGKESIL